MEKLPWQKKHLETYFGNVIPLQIYQHLPLWLFEEANSNFFTNKLYSINSKTYNQA